MRSFPDIDFVERETGRLALDLFLPPEKPPTGVVLFAHGGGFAKGHRKSDFATRLAERLSESGLAMASVSYRLNAGSELPPETRRAVRANQQRALKRGVQLRPKLIGPNFEVARQDIGAAIAFLRSDAAPTELTGLKIGMIGISAGGIAGLSLLHPPINLPAADAPACLVALGATVAHPWALVADAAPAMMIHSVFDRVVPHQNCDSLAPRIERARAPITLMQCARRGHDAPNIAVMEDDAPNGTPYWNLMLSMFASAGLLNQAPASV